MFGINLFKKKKPWIRFYSLEPGLAECYPLIPTSKIKRQWLDPAVKKRRCPLQGSQNSSNCPGIKQIARLGWTVVAPMDFIIITNGDGISFQYEVPNSFQRHSNDISDHAPEQVMPLIDSPRDTLEHINKMELPWRVRASDDIVMLQSPVHWNNEPRFEAVNGVFDPRFALQLNVQLMWHEMDTGPEGTLVKAGTPIAQYIPIPRTYLERDWYDVVQEPANAKDWELEAAFNYSIKSEYMIHDNVQGRISRAMKTIKYHSDGEKL